MPAFTFLGRKETKHEAPVTSRLQQPGPLESSAFHHAFSRPLSILLAPLLVGYNAFRHGAAALRHENMCCRASGGSAA